METKIKIRHTPEDWELIKLEPSVGFGKFAICSKAAPGGLAIIMGGLGEEEEAANARLLLAAPKLLSFAKQSRDLFTEMGIMMAGALPDSTAHAIRETAKTLTKFIDIIEGGE